MKFRNIFFLLLFSQSLFSFSITKEQATEFLFQTMSLPDILDYSKDFYLNNIEQTFKAREDMPWGKIVPDKEFLYFVLPLRVNNENLDYSRTVFYEELKDRVKCLSMKDAILEVNHWCHEKATYQPSDGRTSSPLSTVSQAIGRCGEESTFTVAALRSVGIPARQIYTPRWAHTDDNHAWVEAWADGEWYFLGACEPEPVLDLGWFNSPASRGILMSTNVTGNYPGPEEILASDNLMTRINVTDKYAETGKLPVKVIDKNGKPVENADVIFTIYNYAEYYPAVIKKSDINGEACLISGLGDILVWATDGKNYGYSKGNPKDYNNSNTPLIITIDKYHTFDGEFEYDIIPPKGGSLDVVVSEELKNINDSRKIYEDSVRNSYVASFIKDDEINLLAEKLSLHQDTLNRVLKESRGNYSGLIKLLNGLDSNEKVTVLKILSVVSEKDRRDIGIDTLTDHIKYSKNITEVYLPANFSTENKIEIYDKYILNPRIELEMITPWRSIITNEFGEEILTEFRNNPVKMKAWVEENIKLVEKENPRRLRISPIGVLKSKKADPLSRKIFYVALARTAGLPSRIDPITSSLQIMNIEGEWQDISFNDEKASMTEIDSNHKGWLVLDYEEKGNLKEPKYGFHFTISKIENGQPNLMEFEEGASINKLFSKPVKMNSGQYIITSGRRLANGGVLAHSEIFKITENDTVKKSLIIRSDDSQLSVIGNLNAENIYHDIGSRQDKSILSTTGRGYYVLGLISPNHEPSEHILNEMMQASKDFNNIENKFLFLFDDKESSERFNRNRFEGLPKNVVFGIDTSNVSRDEILKSLNLDTTVYPLLVVADSFNRIIWVSEGYSIGTAQKLIDILSHLE